MIERVKTTLRTGCRVIWDGTNPDEVREVAGDRFTGVWEGMAVVTGIDNRMTYLQHGWSVVTWDDGGVLTIYGLTDGRTFEVTGVV
jgi:hypothetical protein